MNSSTVKPHHLRTYGRSEGVQMANAQMANLITNREKYIWAVTAENPPTSKKKKKKKKKKKVVGWQEIR